MIPIKDKYKKFGTDPTLEDQIRIYKTKKSILDRPSVKHLKKARGEIWPKCSEKKKQHKNYQDEGEKSAINKN